MIEVYKVFAMRKDGTLESCIKYQFAKSSYIELLDPYVEAYLGKLVKVYKPGRMVIYNYPRYVYTKRAEAKNFVERKRELLHIFGHKRLVIWVCETPQLYTTPFFFLKSIDISNRVGTGKPISWHNEHKAYGVGLRHVVTKLRLVKEIS